MSRRFDTALGLDARRGPVAIVLRTALYALVVFVFAGPLLALLISAFSPVTDPTRLTLVPGHLTLANFTAAVDQGVLRYLANSLIVVGGGLLLLFGLRDQFFPGIASCVGLAVAGASFFIWAAATKSDPVKSAYDYIAERRK